MWHGSGYFARLRRLMFGGGSAQPEQASLNHLGLRPSSKPQRGCAMKRTKTKTEITVATRQRITIRRRSQPDAWCEQCGATVGMLLPEHAAVLSNTTPREIYRRVENGEVHFVETREGDLFICCSTITSIKPAEAVRLTIPRG